MGVVLENDQMGRSLSADKETGENPGPVREQRSVECCDVRVSSLLSSHSVVAVGKDGNEGGVELCLRVQQCSWFHWRNCRLCPI